MRAHVLDEPGDPLHVLLDRDRHVGQHGRALRPGDDEQVREPAGGEAEVGTRAVRPLVPQPQPVPAGDAHAEQGAGHRVESGGVDDRVDLVLALAGPHAARGDLLDRHGPRVQQRHVVPVEGLVVAVLQRRPLGEERMVLRRQQFRDGRILDHLADLASDELGDRVVAVLVDQVVAERLQAHVEAALGPGGLEDGLPFLRREVHRGPLFDRVREPEAGQARLLPQARVVRLDPAPYNASSGLFRPGMS